MLDHLQSNHGIQEGSSLLDACLEQRIEIDCDVCGNQILFEEDCMGEHLRKNHVGMGMEEYFKTYVAFAGKNVRLSLGVKEVLESEEEVVKKEEVDVAKPDDNLVTNPKATCKDNRSVATESVKRHQLVEQTKENNVTKPDAKSVPNQKDNLHATCKDIVQRGVDSKSIEGHESVEQNKETNVTKPDAKSVTTPKEILDTICNDNVQTRIDSKSVEEHESLKETSKVESTVVGSDDDVEIVAEVDASNNDNGDQETMVNKAYLFEVQNAIKNEESDTGDNLSKDNIAKLKDNGAKTNESEVDMDIDHVEESDFMDGSDDFINETVKGATDQETKADDDQELEKNNENFQDADHGNNVTEVFKENEVFILDCDNVALESPQDTTSIDHQEKTHELFVNKDGAERKNSDFQCDTDQINDDDADKEGFGKESDRERKNDEVSQTKDLSQHGTVSASNQNKIELDSAHELLKNTTDPSVDDVAQNSNTETVVEQEIREDDLRAADDSTDNDNVTTKAKVIVADEHLSTQPKESCNSQLDFEIAQKKVKNGPVVQDTEANAQVGHDGAHHGGTHMQDCNDAVQDDSSVEPNKTVETPAIDPVETPVIDPIETPTIDPIETPTIDPIETSVSDQVETPVSDQLEIPNIDPVETPDTVNGSCDHVSSNSNLDILDSDDVGKYAKNATLESANKDSSETLIELNASSESQELKNDQDANGTVLSFDDCQETFEKADDVQWKDLTEISKPSRKIRKRLTKKQKNLKNVKMFRKIFNNWMNSQGDCFKCKICGITILKVPKFKDHCQGHGITISEYFIRLVLTQLGFTQKGVNENYESNPESGRDGLEKVSDEVLDNAPKMEPPQVFLGNFEITETAIWNTETEEITDGIVETVLDLDTKQNVVRVSFQEPEFEIQDISRLERPKVRVSVQNYPKSEIFDLPNLNLKGLMNVKCENQEFLLPVYKVGHDMKVSEFVGFLPADKVTKIEDGLKRKINYESNVDFKRIKTEF